MGGGTFLDTQGSERSSPARNHGGTGAHGENENRPNLAQGGGGSFSFSGGWRGAEEQAVLFGDVAGDGLCVNRVAARTQASSAGHVDRERAVDPAGEAPEIASRLVLTTWQHDDPGARAERQGEHLVGEAAARVGGNNQIPGVDLHLFDPKADQLHAKVDGLLESWLREGSLPAERSVGLGSVLATLRELYREHIHVEEAEVFPLAGSLLSPSELSAMGTEMRARRGLAAPE